MTERETAEIQAGRSFSLAIPHSVAASPFSQTGGNNGPAWLSFLVREANMLRNQAGTLVEKPSGTRRSWWVGDLFNIGGRAQRRPFLQRSESRMKGGRVIYSCQLPYLWQVFPHSKQGKKNPEEGSLS